MLQRQRFNCRLDQSAAGSRNNPFGKSLYVETEIFEFKDGVMDDLLLMRVPVAKTGMLVRKPVADVFEAILTSQSSSTESYSSSPALRWIGSPFHSRSAGIAV